MKESGRRRFIAALSVIFVASGQAQGGTWTWCGAGSDNRWSTEANWAETGRPTSHYTTRLIFAGWMRLTPDQDIEETFLFNSLVFSTNAGPFQFDGTVVYSGLPGLRNYKFAGSSPSLAVLGTNNVLIKGALITRDEQCDHWVFASPRTTVQVPWIKGGLRRRVVKDGQGTLRVFEHADGQRYATTSSTVGPEYVVCEGTVEMGTRADRYVLSGGTWVRDATTPKVAYNLVVGDGIGSATSAVFRLIGPSSAVVHANTRVRVESDGLLDLGNVQDLDLQTSVVLTNRAGIIRLGGRSLRLREGNQLYLFGNARIEGTATDSIWLTDGCEVIVDATGTRAVIAADSRLVLAVGKAVVFNVADKPGDEGDLEITGHLGAGGQGGKIRKQGLGTMVISNHTAGGGTTNVVARGTLRIEGTAIAGSGSAWVVLTNAVLGGNGKVFGADVVVDGGTIDPGSGLGSLTVGQNVFFRGRATLKIDVGRADRVDSVQSDRLVVGGNVAGIENIGLVLHVERVAEFGKATTRIITCANDLRGSSFREVSLLGRRGTVHVDMGHGFVDVTITLPQGTGLLIR